MGVLQHVHRHRGLAAELARQRPFGARAVGQDAAEDAAAGRGAGDLLDLGLAVDREQPDAELIGARDVALLLDGVAVGDAVGRGAGRQHHLDLGDRGGVEAGAERGQQRQHLRRRIGLHRVEHPRVGQRLGEGVVVVAHDVEVDDEAGPSSSRFRGGCAGTRGCARSWRSPPQLTGGEAARCKCGLSSAFRGARWRRAGDDGLSTRGCCLGLDGETPHRTAGNEGQASSVSEPAVGRPAETKEARSVVALSRVPR